MVSMFVVNEIRFKKSDVKDKDDKPIEIAFNSRMLINPYHIAFVEPVEPGKVDNVKGATVFITMLTGREILADISLSRFEAMLRDSGKDVCQLIVERRNS